MATDGKTKILREGERYTQQGKISLAINEYLKVLKIDPDDVLTLNTIGDLYLRQGRMGEANRIFLQVADNYTRNNFLLKAIAVYKKILNTNPNNLEVNLLLASLYARQGMNVDARSQYLLVAELCTQEGKTRESLEAYEKVVAIDPMNSPIQLKLAENYLGQGDQEKAHLFFAGAARALMKVGDIPAAMSSFRRALAINLASSEVLKGFLETALQADDLKGALDQVKESIDSAPDDLALHEVLGRAYQAAGDLDRAEKYFQSILDADESRYEYFLPLSKAFLEAGVPDRALHCLDRIVPAVISQRQTERLVDAYQLILEKHPSHIETLEKLAEMFSATNDEARYIAALETITQHYQDSGQPEEALETLERILQIAPDNAKFLRRHREIFESAFPERFYEIPRAVLEARGQSAPRHLEPASGPAALGAEGDDTVQATLVEIDLLLNYGMKDKALQLLRTLETNAPLDKEMRLRLISIYRETGDNRLAAEQCVLLSAIQQKTGDPDAAQKSMKEAEKLAPDWAKGLDVTSYALQHGISLEAQRPEVQGNGSDGQLEVDLSGDLSEIFFKDAQAVPELEQTVPDEQADAVMDEFPQEIPIPPAPESVEEQLQEIDFYIRLGFNDEARAKLDELATSSAGNPELISRYDQLGLKPPDNLAQAPAAPSPTAEPYPHETPSEAAATGIHDIPLERELEMDTRPAWQEPGLESEEMQAIPLPAIEQEPATSSPIKLTSTSHAPHAPAGDFQPNAMFADLIQEVNAQSNLEIAREDFETHFNLGIAYREMGLTEDAIKEFQSAVKGLDAARCPREVIQCCGMLATCYMEKGMHRSAIRWCQTGLNVKDISSDETIALRYDMGVAHSAAGNPDRALECFSQIFGIDPGYRDVAQRIDDLKSGLEQHAP